MVHQKAGSPVESGVSRPHSPVMQWFFLLFPFFELWTLIELGAATSPLLAIGWVVLGIVLGMSMIRRQGLNMIRQAQRDAAQQSAAGGFITPRFLGDDLAVVTAGFLLMVPGLVTDTLALIVLVGPLRRGLLGIAPARYRSQATFRAEYRAHSTGSDPQSSSDPVTLEGDFQRVEDRNPRD